jgi:HEPN domain-containing protein
MKENQRQLIQAWVSKAENDLLNVRNNLQAEQVPWDTVCFHCQQAAEKYWVWLF